MKNYKPIKDSGQWTIGERVDDCVIINDGICTYYWWDTEAAAAAAAEAYNAYDGPEYLGNHGYGYDTIDLNDYDDDYNLDSFADMIALYSLFDAVIPKEEIMKKFLTLDTRNNQEGYQFVAFFDTLEEANESAKTQWSLLTDREKQDRTIGVFIVREDWLDEPGNWESWHTLDSDETMFRS